MVAVTAGGTCRFWLSVSAVRSAERIFSVRNETKHPLGTHAAVFVAARSTPVSHRAAQAGLILGLFGGTSRNSEVATRCDPHVLVVGDPGLGKSQARGSQLVAIFRRWSGGLLPLLCARCCLRVFVFSCGAIVLLGAPETVRSSSVPPSFALIVKAVSVPLLPRGLVLVANVPLRAMLQCVCTSSVYCVSVPLSVRASDAPRGQPGVSAIRLRLREHDLHNGPDGWCFRETREVLASAALCARFGSRSSGKPNRVHVSVARALVTHPRTCRREDRCRGR